MKKRFCLELNTREMELLMDGLSFAFNSDLINVQSNRKEKYRKELFDLYQELGKELLGGGKE